MDLPVTRPCFSFLLLVTMWLACVFGPAVRLNVVAQGYVWAQSAGSTGEDEGTATAIDAVGNVYVTGQFSGTAEFAGTNLVSTGLTDVFVAKYDSSGSLLWVRSAGGSQLDRGQGICVSPGGHIYVTGHFQATASFGSTNLTAIGSLSSGTPANLFLAKYSDSGDLVWVQQSGGVGGGSGVAVAADRLGNSYVTGYTVTFNSERRIYIAKRNDNGQIEWSKEYAGTPNTHFANQGSGIAVDTNGNVLVTGSFSTSMSFDGISLTAVGQTDMLVCKFTNAGALEWVRSGGGTFFDDGYGLAVDPAGNVYVTGRFFFTASFGTTNISTEFNSTSNSDIFFAKYSPSGQFAWVRRIGGSNHEDVGYGIGIDAKTNVFVSGRYFSQIHISRHDTEGNYLWALEVRSGTSHGIAVDPRGQAFFTGRLTTETFFDSIFVTNRGVFDVFVSKVFDEIAPVVLTQLASPILRTRESTSFSISARSIVAVSYQWLLNGNPIAGATNSFLLLQNLGINQSGTYTIVASNIYGVTSRSTMLVVQGRYITGQWDFDDGDLSATIGNPLSYRGDTETVVLFTNGLIAGLPAAVMRFSSLTTNQGFVLSHGAVPNKGGPEVQQWTLLMDAAFENADNQRFFSFLQTDPLNSNSAELFARWNNGAGGLGSLNFPTQRTITTNKWHRIVFAVEVFPSSTTVSKYIDGLKVADEGVVSSARDFSLEPSALLFTANTNAGLPGWVNSIQFRDYKMTDADIAKLGRPSPAGLPAFRLTSEATNDGERLRIGVWALDDTVFTNAAPSNLAIYAASSLSASLSDWARINTPLVASNGVLWVEEDRNPGQRFYTLVRE